MKTTVAYRCTQPKCDHRLCDGDMVVLHPVMPDPSVTIPRFQGGVRRHSSQMFLEWQQHVVRRYALSDSQVVPLVRDNFAAMMAIFDDNIVRETTRLIRPPFIVNNRVTQKPRLDVSHYLKTTQSIDRQYLSMLLPGVRIPVEWLDGEDIAQVTRRGVPTLLEICVRRFSLTNYVHGTYYGRRQWLSTEEDIPPSINYNMYQQFHHFNSDRGPSHARVMGMMHHVLPMYYQMMGTSDKIRTYKFRYNPARIMMEMNLISSSGIMSGGTMPIDTEIGTIKRVSTGIKVHHLARVVAEHQKWVRDTMAGEIVHIDSFNVVKMKGEVKVAYMGNLLKLDAIPDKKREFYITGLNHTFHGLWLLKDRMLADRGNVVNIGRIWWFGGAKQFAQYLNADLPGISWAEGDWYHYDKNVQDTFIYLWVATTMNYYDVDSMSDREQRLFYRAFAEYCYNSVVKPTAHIGELWSEVIGTIASGGPDTSPFGSFVNVISWLLFLVWTMQTYPQHADAIRLLIKEKIIVFACYGDDFLYSYPTRLKSILGVKQFAQFVKIYLMATIRDLIDHDTFYAKPDSFGNVLKPAPKFLKRMFIKDGDNVLPYKPTNETIAHLFAPRTIFSSDIVLASIGQAWDTMFTNPIAYEICLIAYTEHMRRDGRGFDKLYASLTSSDRADYELKLLKKLNITSEQLAHGFPIYDIERARMHRFDPDRIDFSVSYVVRHMYDFMKDLVFV